MAKSKAWDWESVTGTIWHEPSEDAYYYLNRWKKQGFKKFLDLGCGLGRHSILFAQNGFEVDALDLSDKGLEVLKEKAEGLGFQINLSLGDMNSLPYASESFDCLLAYHVISHTDSVGIKKIIEELGRVLKTGGEFFITLCSKNSPSFASGRYKNLDANTILKDEEPEVDVPHFYSDTAGVKELLREFEIIRLRHIEDIYDNTSGWHYFIHGRKI